MELLFIFVLDLLPQLTLAALNSLQFSQRLKHADELRTEKRSFLYCGEQVIIGLRGVPMGTDRQTHTCPRNRTTLAFRSHESLKQLMVIQISLH